MKCTACGKDLTPTDVVYQVRAGNIQQPVGGDEVFLPEYDVDYLCSNCRQALTVER